MDNNIIDNTNSSTGYIAWIIKALPWIAAPIIFLMVCNHFFAPQFDDKALGQDDIVQYEGMSHDIKEHRKATGEDPQWTGGMFSGMPAYLIDVEYPTQDVKQSLGQVVKVVDEPMGIIFFAMILMMLAVVLMGINPWIGIIAGLAYGLSTYFFLIIDAGHITKAWAMVYAPPLVGAVWYTLRKNMWVGGVLAALFGSLELGANHPQITYYFLLVCAALWLSEMWFTHRNKAWRSFGKRTAILAIAALLAGTSNFAPLWYAASHQKHTVRGVGDNSKSEEEARKEKIAWNTKWSYGKAESFNMLVPNYMGATSLKERSIKESDEIYNTLISDYAIERLNKISDQQLHNETIWSLQEQFEHQYGGSFSFEKVEEIVFGNEELYNYYNEEKNILYNQLFNGYAREGVVKMELSEPMRNSTLYWGEQPFTAGPTYLGAVAIFLAILGVMVTSGRNRWWLLAITIFSIFLAWGKNMMWFYELMFDMLPGYSSYRTVSMALVVVEWSVVVMAAYALMALWRSELPLRRLIISILSATGIVLLLIVLMGATTDYGVEKLDSVADTWWGAQVQDAAAKARRDLFMADAWRTVIYVSLATIVLLAYAWFKHNAFKQKIANRALPYVMLLAIGGLITSDLSDVNERYLNKKSWHEKSSTEIKPSAADKQILSDKELGFRVFDIDNSESSYASNFHRSVDGYHGAKLGRYNDVLNTYIYRTNDNVLSMLNVKYRIQGGIVLPYSTLGAAWFVERPKQVASAKEAFEAIGHEELGTYAIVEPSSPRLKGNYDTSGSIRLVEYAPNYLKYEYDSAKEALAVFSEIYYPDGWTAYIDGKDAEYFCADYIMRGMELPAGKHTVEWKFRAPHWNVATAITGIGSWLILIAVVCLIMAPLSRRYLLPYIRERYNIKRR